MTRSSAPRTYHQLQEFALGRPLTRLEAGAIPDRPLTRDERRELRGRRVAGAELGRRSPARLHHGIPDGEGGVRMGWEDRTVGYYRRAVQRFERWARRAERLGLPKGRPPGHIAEKAVAAATMLQAEGGR